MKKALRSAAEYASVCAVGGIVYSTLEIMWRGFTHWSMAAAGGLCLLMIYIVEKRRPLRALWQKCLYGSLFITSVEFIVGMIVNEAMDWQVWDYSDRMLNICGQICPLYSGLWFLLTIPAVFICDLLRDGVFGR